MNATIRQTVTVQEEGRIEICSPDLHPGSTAEVTVVVAEPQTPSQRLALLDQFQKSLGLTQQKAEAWAKQVREERIESSERRLDSQAE